MSLHIHIHFFRALTGSEGGSYLLPWIPKPWEARYEAKKSHFTRSVYVLLNHLYYVATSNSIMPFYVTEMKRDPQETEWKGKAHKCSHMQNKNKQVIPMLQFVTCTGMRKACTSSAHWVYSMYTVCLSVCNTTLCWCTPLSFSLALWVCVCQPCEGGHAMAVISIP